MVHDEAKDLQLLSKIAKIDRGGKIITISVNQPIGNRRWGRLDFLTRYRGWHLVRSGNLIAQPGTSERTSKREEKEMKKKRNNKKMYA